MNDMNSKKAKIICIVNQKGGVGKTTTAVNLSAALSAIEKKILVIDLDPQGNASTGFGLKSMEREVNIYDVLVGKIEIEQAIKKTSLPNLQIIPSTLDLAASEFELQKLPNWHYILQKKLDSILSKYDFIFIDCPPSLGLLTINSLVAANSVLIPLQCEFYALEGISHLIETIQKVKKHLNKDLQIEGVVLTMFDKRNNLSKNIERDVRENLGDIVYKTVITRNVALPESTSHGMPVILYNINSPGSQSYIALAKEIKEKYINGASSNMTISANENNNESLDEYIISENSIEGFKEDTLN